MTDTDKTPRQRLEEERAKPISEHPPEEPSGPSPHKIYVEMEAREPYQVRELVEEFETNRWTIKRRLERLVEEGFINKKEHSENSTSYWRPRTAQEKSHLD